MAEVGPEVGPTLHLSRCRCAGSDANACSQARWARWARARGASGPRRPPRRRAGNPRSTPRWPFARSDSSPPAAVRPSAVVGRGHVSLLTKSETWHSKRVRDIGYLHSDSSPSRCKRLRVPVAALIAEKAMRASAQRKGSYYTAPMQLLIQLSI